MAGDQDTRRRWLIDYLLGEREDYAGVEVPDDVVGQRRLLRALMNMRMPDPIGADFLGVQDAYLRGRATEKGVTRLADLAPVRPGTYLWQGDITTLGVGAIVNAANSQMLGCFVPNHGCIDNAIHTYAGVELRLACADLMRAQGHEEPTGQAKVTPGFNLPAAHVLHTVGPIVDTWDARPTARHRRELASCYRSCLDLAAAEGIGSVAFCCISTGEFRFPNAEAARIAVETVDAWRSETGSVVEVVYNVFKDEDLRIYQHVLGV